MSCEIFTWPFDASNYLKDEAAVAAYPRITMEESDLPLLAVAMGDVDKTRGITQLARDTGLSRESLYKSLSGERAQRRHTVQGDPCPRV